MIKIIGATFGVIGFLLSFGSPVVYINRIILKEDVSNEDF